MPQTTSAQLAGSLQIKVLTSADKYVIVITKAQPMGRLRGHMVYKVIATEFLPIRERPVRDPDEDTYDCCGSNVLFILDRYYQQLPAAS
jgi:hypothetical protein